MLISLRMHLLLQPNFLKTVAFCSEQASCICCFDCIVHKSSFLRGEMLETDSALWISDVSKRMLEFFEDPQPLLRIIVLFGY